MRTASRRTSISATSTTTWDATRRAVGYYTDALGLNPGYADAHFYLAVTLEKMGRSAESKTHWRAYQQLAPDGEWVDLAKQFSE